MNQVKLIISAMGGITSDFFSNLMIAVMAGIIAGLLIIAMSLEGVL